MCGLCGIFATNRRLLYYLATCTVLTSGERLCLATLHSGFIKKIKSAQTYRGSTTYETATEDWLTKHNIAMHYIGKCVGVAQEV